jgi:hypothetical protein
LRPLFDTFILDTRQQEQYTGQLSRGFLRAFQVTSVRLDHHLGGSLHVGTARESHVGRDGVRQRKFACR